jgi:cell division protein FtsZ
MKDMVYEQEYEMDFQNGMPKIIKVIGVGGAGGNAIQTMHKMGIHDVDIVACNTDLQVLRKLPEEIKRIQLGIELTKGLGAGAQPKVGEQAAIESEDVLYKIFDEPTEMVFITAGMGGGTGTGAAPVIARIAKERNMLTIGVVTDPFNWEGTEKIEQALEGIERMKEHCDTVLIVKNDRLEELYPDMNIQEAFEKADRVLANGVKSIAELITRPGIINLDYADVKTVLKDAGQAVMGSAEASGPNRAEEAVKEALKSPLLQNNNIKGSKRLLVSISHSDEKPEYQIKMKDQAMIMKIIESQIKTKAKIVKHGYSIDRSLGEKLRITIVAAGITEMGNEFYEPTVVAEKDTEEVFRNKTSPRSQTGTKRRVASKPNGPQITIFGSQEKLFQTVEDYTSGSINYKQLVAEPAYERYGIQVRGIEEIPVENMIFTTVEERLSGVKP